jgi:hypothetical protein
LNSDSDLEDIEEKSSRKKSLQNLKNNWSKEYKKTFVHSFNPLTCQFETLSSGPSDPVQCARGANSLEISKMFRSIPSELCFRDNHVTLEELRAARASLQHQQQGIPCFEDTAANDQNTSNNSNSKNLSHQRNGCFQFLNTLDIPASTASRSRSEEVIRFPNSILELKLSSNKCLALPPLCSRGTKNWMHSIVHADQTKKRVAQLIGYKNRLSQLVNDRWFKLIKMEIFMEKSFERHWSVLEKHLDMQEQFTEYSKWTARCTLAYVQDHMYAMLRELVYLFERVSYKNNFSNAEASKADMLFKSLEYDASLLPYPIRQLTQQEENKEVYKLCVEATQAGCSPYRRFISPKWMETGHQYLNN